MKQSIYYSNFRIGFYYVNLFIENEWKEVVLDDLVPVYKLV